MINNKVSYAICFCMAFLVLFVCGFSSISVENYPVGDFAANGLLIQDAINSILLTGNYSRVGFNHPGPAILYVLAFGEYFFYNVLDVVPSAFSGQLLAVCLYNSFWITCCFRVLISIVRDRHWAIFILSFILVFISLDFIFIDTNYKNFFTGIWMPHLYFFPFLTFTLAIFSICYGRVDNLIILALSLGFLVNGHVAFVPTIIITGLLILSYDIISNRGIKSSLIGVRSLITHRRVFLLSLSTVFLFFIPLIYLTIVDFPGPVGQYYSFSSGEKGNNLTSSLYFISNYWGGNWVMLISGLIMVFVFLFKVMKKDYDIKLVSSLLVVVTASTLALLFYAKVAVDHLDQEYIALYYYAIPVITFAFLVYVITKAFLEKISFNIILLLVVLSATIIVSLSHDKQSYSANYNDNRIVNVSESLKEQAGLRWVLELDSSKDWGTVWSQILGIMLQNKVSGIDPFCVNNNWHISFTKATICTKEELSSGQRFLISTKDFNGQEPDFKWLDLNVFTIDSNLSPNKVYYPNSSHYSMLNEGWSIPGEQFIWTDGYRASVAFSMKENFDGKAVFDVSSFPGEIGRELNIDVLVNGVATNKFSFNKNNNRKNIEVNFNTIDTDGHRVMIELLILNPASPFELGMSQDKRMLGLKLYSVTIKE